MSTIDTLLQKQIQHDVVMALEEDIGSGDISAQIIAKEHSSTAHLITCQDMILCGSLWFEGAFKKLAPDIVVKWQFNDGDMVRANTTLCSIEGNSRAILSAERTALNFLQTLSATATITSRYVAKIKNYKAKILDTRKTIPGFRLAQKYAVSIGGGQNHRLGLFDAFLLKENHIKASGDIKSAVSAARDLKPNSKIEIEVENLFELKQALTTEVEQILLDNFSFKDIKSAVALVSGKTKLEASGNVSLKNIEDYAKTGVDYISVGALTKNIMAVDLSLRL